MKIRVLLLVIGLLALAVVPAFAQETNTVSFNGFSFSYPTALAANVAISQLPADDPALEQPGGPNVRHSEFTLYNGALQAEGGFFGEGTISVYATADFEGYALASTEYTRLQTLLADRPDLAAYTVADDGTNANNLPYLPVVGAAQVVRAQPRYVDTAAVQGISYLTSFRQDASPFTGNQFLYTFQGLSTDGAYYVSAVFYLDTSLFPAEIPADFDYDALSADFAGYLTETIGTLNAAAPEDFTPSLATLDAVIQSFSFAPETLVPETGSTPAPEVTPEPTVITGDAQMGGLASANWTLTAYGPADAPAQLVANAPITMVFSESGVGGRAGCNTYGGSFTFDNSTISFSEMVRTMMACDGPTMQQEEAFLAALETASTYQVSGSQLTIDYDGGALVFTAG